MLSVAMALLRSQWRRRRLVMTSSVVEMRKRHAGSLLGPVWLLLYPLMFLGVYLFVWMVVFNVRFPGYNELDYVVFVFAALVPFLLLSEVATGSVAVIRQNMHLVKSVIMPLETLPTRVVVVAFLAQSVGLGVVVALSALNGTLSWQVLLLPVVIGIHLLFLLGLAWFLAPVGVMVPDAVQVVQLMTSLLMFLSPIAFKTEMVPHSLQAVLLLNPVTYMVEAYRSVLIAGYPISIAHLAGFAATSVAMFVIGATFCGKFKDFIVDFE